MLRPQACLYVHVEQLNEGVLAAAKRARALHWRRAAICLGAQRHLRLSRAAEATAGQHSSRGRAWPAASARRPWRSDWARPVSPRVRRLHWSRPPHVVEAAVARRSCHVVICLGAPELILQALHTAQVRGRVREWVQARQRQRARGQGRESRREQAEEANAWARAGRQQRMPAGCCWCAQPAAEVWVAEQQRVGGRARRPSAVQTRRQRARTGPSAATRSTKKRRMLMSSKNQSRVHARSARGACSNGLALTALKSPSKFTKRCSQSWRSVLSTASFSRSYSSAATFAFASTCRK